MSNFRSKAFNPASKRVEDAEYCDDYYGRHRYGIRFDDGCVHPEAQCGIDAAATAIDSLLKERDALQARVKELERDCAEAYQVVGCLSGSHDDLFNDAQVTKALDNLSSASNGDPRPHDDLLPFSPIFVGDPVFAAEARALRAEQERDEAYERIKDHLDHLDGGLQLLATAVKANDPQKEILWRIEEELRQVRRLAAGPEKEG